jgi:DNA-binding NarL/FixJ family response regulator
MSEKIRVILFEDNERARKSTERIFRGSETIFFAAALPDATRAAKDVEQYEPDVILMDIQMPQVNGIDALATIKARFPEVKILMLTSISHQDAIFAAICNGASGYVMKEDLDGIVQTIHEVHELGAAHTTPEIAKKMMQLLQSQQLRPQPHYVKLTDREMDVLRETVDGKSRKEVATALTITFDVVGDHLKSIYKKLHVNSATAAVREAILRRIV